MDLSRILLIGALVIVGVLTLRQWHTDYHSASSVSDPVTAVATPVPLNVLQSAGAESDMPTIRSEPLPNSDSALPSLATQLVTVTTDVLQVTIDPAGGDVVGLVLPEYPVQLPKEDQEPQPFQLLVNRPGCSGEETCVYTAQSALVKTDGPDSNNQRQQYNVDKQHFQLTVDQEQLSVNLWRHSGAIEIIKRFTFQRGRYEIRVDYQITNNGKTPWQDQFYAQLKRDHSKDPSAVASNAPMNTYLGAAVRSLDETYRKLPFDDIGKNPFNERVKGGYAAILQHYFVSAWVPDQQTAHNYYSKENQGRYAFVGFYDDVLTAQPGETVMTGTTLYAGPKLQENLKPLAEGLQLTVDYGILWFLAQPLFILLKWIESVVGNWGWAIILLTVLVKAMFYPLNVTSFRSMAKMRKLGPKMQALKEQYGDDRQKMSQAIMTLYKKEKVNPMGGCLPILVQMPVFIALYWVLLESVELRQAPWLGWIQDLSQMDPYFILPLIMGGSMLIQQQLTPMSFDPVQAKVMKFMPVIFTFFFLWFPSGLVLYWVTNNVLSIIQQYIITQQIDGHGQSHSLVNSS